MTNVLDYLATFLDPNYGPDFFDKAKQCVINEINLLAIFIRYFLLKIRFNN